MEEKEVVSPSLPHTSMAVTASTHQHRQKGGFDLAAAPKSERNLCVWRSLLVGRKNSR